MEVEDQDAGDNITYSISTLTSNIDTPLSIHRYSGEISFAVDYDVDNGAMPGKLLVNITAADTGNAIGSTLLVVTILDINDNGPTFPFNYFTLFVPQNISVGTTVLNLTTVDPDRAATTMQLTIYYRGGSEPHENDNDDYYDDNDDNEPQDYFQVTTEGAINVARSLDTNETQTFPVVAIDVLGRKEGNVTVIIGIIPNDSAVTLSASSSTAADNSTTKDESKPSASCCCSKIKKMDWMIPLTPILCTKVLVILLILTRYIVM